MRIFVAGSDKVFAIELLYVKYLRQHGADVFHFAGQSMFYDFYQKNIFNKVLFRSGLSNIYRKINTEFRKAVAEFKPGIIWIFKGMEITPDSIKWAKSQGCKVVNYNPDNPLLFSGKGSGNKNVTDSIPLFDLYLSYDWEVIAAIKKLYSINADLLPFGFDVSQTVFDAVQQQEEINKVCFLGNPDTDRAAFINELSHNGIAIDVYGNNWAAFVKNKNITCYPAVYQKDYWQTLYKYRVQLNLMRPHNPRSHNMRTFELGGIGAIQLAPDTPDHKTYFNPGTEIFVYNGVEDCIRKVHAITNLTPAAAKQVRYNARARSINSKYSYCDRAAEAISLFERYFPQLNKINLKN
jgi:spore maturation protein CgeB